MIDRDALHAALREFYTGKCNTDTSHVPSTCVRKAIEAYLAAAPLPGAGPVAWRWEEMLDDKPHWRYSRTNRVKYAEPLYTAAPLPDVAADRLGKWMSAALEDETVCAEMKADINAWFRAGQPTETAPLPGAGEPVGYIDGPRFDGETGKVREGGAHLFSSGRGLLHPVALYTAAPDTAQARVLP